MSPMKWNGLVALFAMSGLLLAGCEGCNPPPPPPDAGPEIDAGEDAGEDGGPDAGPFLCETDQQCQAEFDPDTVCDDVEGASTFGTCVKRCRNDDQCEVYQVGLRCNETTGHCIVGRGCQMDSNCPPPGFDPADYCNITGPGCRCVQEDHPSGLGGVCRRRLSVCDECRFDEQCGSGATFDPSGLCRSLQGDPEGSLPDGGVRKYCFYAQQSCGCGMIQSPEGNGLCIPQSASCNQVGCTADDDCPFGSVCGTSGGTCGLCEPRCSWNFDSKKENPPGCGGSKSCWVDPENLSSNSKFFGAGRCREPCQTDAQCEALDPRLECRGEPLSGGGTSAKRCRPKGECMDDFECPEPVAGDIYLGYCDRDTFECKTDCRPGTDPTTGSAFDDCTSGYKCVNQNGTFVCVQQTCLEQGGGRIACQEGHYCCGEDKNGDGMADPCPATGIGTDQCYLALRPPFCQTCATHTDCAGLDNPAGSNLPHRCVEAPPPPGVMGPGARYCGIATHNDWAVNALNISKAQRGCPAKYTATPEKVRCPNQQNSACGPNGICEPDPYDKTQEGGPVYTCLCNADGTVGQIGSCPGAMEAVTNGVQSYCRHAPAGTQQYCLTSVVCAPGTPSIYKPAPPADFGCGLSPPPP